MTAGARTLGASVLPRSEIVDPEQFPTLPYVGLEHIEAHTTKLLGTGSASTMRSTAKRFYAGDVLYSRLRPYLNKVWRAERDGLCSSEFIVLPQTDGLDPDFLCYRLSARDFVVFANGLNAGDRPRVKFAQISSFVLPPFSLAAQRRIASKIDELFSRIDEGERALTRARKLLERYRQSVLKAAITGELTRDWREQRQRDPDHPIESGTALLERILAARRAAWEQSELAKMRARGKPPKTDAWKQKYKPPTLPDASHLTALPEGWVWASVAQIGDAYTGKTPPTKQHGLFGGPLPFFKPTDLDQGYDVRSYRESLTAEGARYCSVLPSMSVLVTCIGATIGKVGLARVQCATNQQINALCSVPRLFNPRYLYWAFVSPHGQREVIGNASATTLPILNKSRFELLPMPVPPLDEQNVIVELVEQWLNAAARLAGDLGAVTRRSSALRQVVLKAAFSGGLVPQVSADEPARVLLERIVAERAAAPAAKPRRRRRGERYPIRTSEPGAT